MVNMPQGVNSEEIKQAAKQELQAAGVDPTVLDEMVNGEGAAGPAAIDVLEGEDI